MKLRHTILLATVFAAMFSVNAHAHNDRHGHGHGHSHHQPGHGHHHGRVYYAPPRPYRYAPHYRVHRHHPGCGHSVSVYASPHGFGIGFRVDGLHFSYHGH